MPFQLLPSITRALAIVIGCLISWKILEYAIREWILIPKLTILKDLKKIGEPRPDGKLGDRAIVCGGSVAGMLAAAVCTSHYEEVVIVEPEAWANNQGADFLQPGDRPRRTADQGYQVLVSPRTRVMQYYLVHFLQPLVYDVVRRLFPTLQEELDELKLEAVVTQLGLHYGPICLGEPWKEGDPEAPLHLPITREQYETILRRLVKSHKHQISFMTGTVTGLRKGTNMDTLSGVEVRLADGSHEELKGELVIDATGPAQLGFTKWLGGAGYAPPPDLRADYDPKMQYTTAVLTIPPHLRNVLPFPGGYGGGIRLGLWNQTPDFATGEQKVLFFSLFAKDQLLITTGGWDIADRPHSLAEIRAYAQTVTGVENAPQWLWELLDVLEAHEDELNLGYADANVGKLTWVQYQKMQGPKNFVAVGDAVMKLNPIYGQGVTKASVDATTLDGALREIKASTASPNVSKSYFKRLAPRIGGLWDGTRANDYGWNTTIPSKGHTLETGKFMRNYGRTVLLLCSEDPEIRRTWAMVTFMLAPVTDMFAPWFLWRVAKKWARG